MGVKEFKTATQQRRAATNQQGATLPDLPFKLDADDYVAIGPKDTQLVYLVTAAAESKADADRVVALLDFIETVIAEPGRARLRRRMLDPKDPLDLETVLDVFNWLMAEWGGNPPTSASA